MKKFLIPVFIFAFSASLFSQAGKWQILDQYSETIDNNPYYISFVSIKCADKDNCVAFGNFSYHDWAINRLTTDGGKIWTTTYKQSDNDRRSVAGHAYPDTGLCLVLLDGGYILRSTDKCHTWSQSKIDVKTTPYFIQEAMIKMYDSKVGAIGHLSDLFITSDGGLSWEKTEFNMPDSISPGSIYDISFVDENKIYILAYKPSIGRYLVKSSDRGKTWTAASVIKYYPHALVFTDENTGWVTGGGSEINSHGYKRDYIAKTENGGQTWKIQLDSTGGNQGLSRIYFTDSRTGFAIGYYSFFLWKTTDGGDNWEIDTSYNYKNLVEFNNDIAVISPDLIYGASLDGGFITRYSNTTSVEANETRYNSNLSIRPNTLHSGESLDIYFSLQGYSNVKFYLINSVGSIVDDSGIYNLDNGEHNIRLISSTNLPAGMYWLRMIVNGRQESSEPIIIY